MSARAKVLHPSTKRRWYSLEARVKPSSAFQSRFPANDFGGQEPGSNTEIAQFCRLNYGVTFPMFARTSVIGVNANPLYRTLAARTGKPPRWNFHKYLLDRTGQPVAVFESAVEPADARITSQIEKLIVSR
jgi:glutathione peroxidase